MQPLYQRTLKTLSDAGHSAYLVGGFVRDTLLGRASKDIDITTSATPDEIAELFPEMERIGAHFSIVLVKDGEESVEIATFRADGDYADQASGPVRFATDVSTDLERRDFTINALLMDASGVVFDHVGGKYDIAQGMIRTVGTPHARFGEDPLRMLRAVRLACQLNFEIDTMTFRAIQMLAHRIKRVAVERVQQELSRILVSGRADMGLRLLHQSYLLAHVLPPALMMVGCPQNPKHHPEGDVFTHTLSLLEKLEPGCSLTLALAALLHDIAKPTCIGFKDGEPTFYNHEIVGRVMAYTILTSLKYPNEVIETVAGHVGDHMRFRVTDEMRRGKLYRFLRQPNFEELLELHRLDALSGSGNLEHYNFVRKVLAEVPPEKLRPEKLLTGRDLIDMGLAPGPKFKAILDAIEEAQLDGKVSTREEALAVVKSAYGVKTESHEEVK